MEEFLIFAILILSVGACIGSFLNVVALRALTNESIVFPSSKCPKCSAPIKWYDNIPVLSYFFTFRGKCRSCGEKVSIQYPIVEAITSLLFLAVCVGFGITLETLFLLIILCVSIVICITDIKEKAVFTRHLWYLIILSFAYSYFVKHDIVGGLIGAVVAVVLMEVISRGAFFLLGNKAIEEDSTEETVEENNEEPKTVLKDIHLFLAMLMSFYLFSSFGLWYALGASLMMGLLIKSLNHVVISLFKKLGKKSSVEQIEKEENPQQQEIVEYIKENKRLFGDGDTYIAAASGAALGWESFIAVFVIAVLLQVACIIPQFLKGLFSYKQFRRLSCILIVLGSVFITLFSKTATVLQYVMCSILLYFGIDYVIRDRLSMRINTSNFIPFAPPLLWATFIMFFFGNYILKVVKSFFI